LVGDYRVREAVKPPNILKEKSAKVKSYYNKTARKVIAFFRHSVYYDYNRVKFEEFKYIREKADKIN
jgi:hypothetical protein